MSGSGKPRNMEIKEIRKENFTPYVSSQIVILIVVSRLNNTLMFKTYKLNKLMNWQTMWKS